MKKALVMAFIVLFLVSIVSALGSLLVSISQDKLSLNLNHGQSDSVTFTISNDNSICSIQCDYALLKNNNEVVDEGSFSSNAGVPKSFSITLRAPTKSEEKQESGTIEYIFGVSCSEIKEWWNTCDGEHTQTSNLLLNYDLTQQEKSARDDLKPRLDEMKLLLQEVESKEFNINSKFDSLPKNVLISDLKQTLFNYISSYNPLKNSYENINSLFGNLEFITASNSFNLNWIQDLSNLKNNLGILDNDIEARLKTHNEIVDKINKLQEEFNTLKVKSQVSNNEIISLSNQIDSLVSNFESGSFSSYDSIEKSINSINSQINTLSNSINEDFNRIVLTGKSLLDTESTKIKKEIDLYYESLGDIDALKGVCSSFETLENSFVEENNLRVNNYNLELKKIEDYNANINVVNDKLKYISSLRNDISEIVNNRGIDELDESNCQEEINKISLMENYDSLNEESYSSCLKLYNEVSEINDQKQGFWFDFLSFLRKFWFNSVKFENIALVEEKLFPNEPTLLDLESDSKEFGEKYCNLDLKVESGSFSSVSNVEGDTLTGSSIEDVIENENLCSSFGITGKCCENDECKYNEESYPVIFLHGHAFSSYDDPAYSLDAFNNMQLTLFQDKYRIGGTFLPTDEYANMVAGEWGKVNFPITVKATYYIGVYNSDGKIVSAPSKEESISTYAQRLSNVVELVKFRTGRNKVNIVAHSMGGLVAREYINNGGESSVHKLIMIGTPNHGTYGGANTLCELVGGASVECAEMRAGSDFITFLNSGDETYGNVKYYTIAGSGCVVNGIDGDGLIRRSSVELNGAKNVKVDGKCEGWSNKDFHSNLLDPSKYSQTLEYVKQFLKE